MNFGYDYENLKHGHFLRVAYDGHENFVLFSPYDSLEVGQLLCDFYNYAPENILKYLPTDVQSEESVDVIRAFFTFCEKFSFKNRRFQHDLIANYFARYVSIVLEYSSFANLESFCDFEHALFLSLDMPKTEIIDFLSDIPHELTISNLFRAIYKFYCRDFYKFKNLLLEHAATNKQSCNLKGSLAILPGYVQDFDATYNIIEADSGFVDCFDIYEFEFLTKFELTHMLKNNIVLKKCANCGALFVDGRADAIYCTNLSPQSPTKTCREIGAQIARINKEKTDVTVSEYRKIYLKFKMTTRRHPENKIARAKLEELTTEVKGWRKQLADGSVTVEDFLDWLKGFQ